MGSCFTTTVPTRVQLSEAHLLGGHVATHHHPQHQHQQVQHNGSDSEPHDFQYQGFNDTSITHNSNLHPVYPSTDSSPKHRPTKINTSFNCSNQNHTDLIKSNTDLQQQIDILKQCSNDEIKMLKTRLQALEKQMYEASHAHIDDDYKENELRHTDRQCTQGTHTKACPNVYRIVKASQIYNDILQSHQQHNELNVWNKMNTWYTCEQLMTDYTHLLDVHCHKNNIFEVKMVYLEISDILNSECKEQDCTSITHIQQNTASFEPNVIYILNVIHCFLYHAYNHENGQRLRDCIMDKNEMLIKYDTCADIKRNVSHLSIDTSTGVQRNDNNRKRTYSQTPPTLISTKSKQLIASMETALPINPRVLNVPLKERHNSVASNLSRRSSENSVHSVQSKSSKSSISALSDNNNDSDLKLILSPILPKQRSAIEMSEDRVRKLSGQMNEEQIKELINEYDNDQKIGIENEDADEEDELVQMLGEEEDENEGSSSLNEDDRAEIEQFKLELNESKEGDEKQRRGSKHHLMRIDQGNEWDTENIDQTVQDMKKQLLHLALTSSTDVDAQR
eukprot:122344_1